MSYLFYFWLHWVFAALGRAFSSCGGRGFLFVVVRRLLVAVASFALEHGLHELWALSSVAVAQGLNCSAHVESSWPRDRTHVPCIGRQIHTQRATEEVL